MRTGSCLQNWVIDTGSEVILVDTGLPAEFPDAAPTPDATIYVGAKIKSYLEALADLGYRPEQVSKILITHKHADHTGMLGAFPKAEIICSAAEAEADETKPFHPTVATFQDGPYHEFPASQKIADGVTYPPTGAARAASRARRSSTRRSERPMDSAPTSGRARLRFGRFDYAVFQTFLTVCP